MCGTNSSNALIANYVESNQRQSTSSASGGGQSASTATSVIPLFKLKQFLYQPKFKSLMSVADGKGFSLSFLCMCPCYATCTTVLFVRAVLRFQSALGYSFSELIIELAMSRPILFLLSSSAARIVFSTLAIFKYFMPKMLVCFRSPCQEKQAKVQRPRRCAALVQKSTSAHKICKSMLT